MDDYKPGQTIRLNAIDADGTALSVLVDNATPGSFSGLVSSSHLAYFRDSAVQLNGAGAWVATNGLTLGTIAAAVPKAGQLRDALGRAGTAGVVCAAQARLTRKRLGADDLQAQPLTSGWGLVGRFTFLASPREARWRYCRVTSAGSAA